jgi:hypothetical protein
MTDDIMARLREYLASGGLFYPELMNHAAVRDLLIDCRHEIGRVRAALRGLIAACDAGRHVERGIGGMTIAAQIDRTVIGGIRARAVEDARVALEGEKKDD